MGNDWIEDGVGPRDGVDSLIYLTVG